MYLCTYTAYQQNDWFKWLGLAEFIINNIISEIIQCSLFYVNYEYNLCMGFEPCQVMTRFLMFAQVKAEEYANHIKDLLNVLHSEMIAV